MINVIPKTIMISNKTGSTNYVITKITNEHEISNLIDLLFIRNDNIGIDEKTNIITIIANDFEKHQFRDLVFTNISDNINQLKELNNKRIELENIIKQSSDQLNKVNTTIKQINGNSEDNNLWIDRAVDYRVN